MTFKLTKKMLVDKAIQVITEVETQKNSARQQKGLLPRDFGDKLGKIADGTKPQ